MPPSGSRNRNNWFARRPTVFGGETINPSGRRLIMTHGVESGDDVEMFDLAPVSLWLEDFSGVGQLFEEWRADGVTDLAVHLRSDLSRIKACSERIRVLK